MSAQAYSAELQAPNIVYCRVSVFEESAGVDQVVTPCTLLAKSVADLEGPGRAGSPLPPPWATDRRRHVTPDK